MIPRLDTTEASITYSDSFRRLGGLPGFDHATVLTAEAGVILKTWAGETQVASPAHADATSRSALLKRLGLTRGGATTGYVTINAGLRGQPGRVWFRTSNNKFQLAGTVGNDGSTQWNSRHFKNDDWASIESAATKYAEGAAEYIRRGRLAAGLARQSVIQIADQLGIDLADVKGGGTLSSAGIAKARAAIASTGRAYQNGTGVRGGDTIKAYVDLINRLPYAQKIGMDSKLASILVRRAKYIETSYSKGAFDSMRNVARAFPNLRITETTGAN